ncbi:MAG: hypothetical protein KAZ88_03660 [Acidimicrobiia bacterium]|nr:hypothetical protein [Acidimicrobiia bacterium]MBP8180073.1 hypothetical protein [Acidimicrobiia bacterium]
MTAGLGRALRRSVALAAIPGFLVVVIAHIALRGQPWLHEWYWAFDQYQFVVIFLAPLVAGIAAWDGARWSRAMPYLTPTGHLGNGCVAATVPSMLVGWGAYVAGLLGAIALATLSTAPGIPNLSIVATSLPPLAMLAMAAAAGSTVGIVTRRAISGAAVAVVLFLLLLVGYTTLPATLLDVGGSTGSLLGLRPRSSVQLLQTALYAAVAVASFGLVAKREDPWAPVRLTSFALILPIFPTAVLVGIGGDAFVHRHTDVVCQGSDPEICLNGGYSFLEEPTRQAVAAPFAASQAAGFQPPKRLTQDLSAVTNTDTGYLGTDAPDPVTVAGFLTFAVIPPECDIGKDRQTYEDYLDVDYWAKSLVGIAEYSPIVSPAVADGDTPKAREHIRAIAERLSECGP